MSAERTSTRQIQLAKTPGGTYGWRLATAPVPAIGEDQVLLQVRAVSIQRGDIEVDDMLGPVFGITADATGQVGGSDAAGVVVQVGSKVRTLRAGQRVVSQFYAGFLDRPLVPDMMVKAHGWTVDGVFGDYVAIDATGLVPMPDYLSFEEAATLPSSAITAWTATGSGKLLRPGSIVLVEGTGGVSAFAIQFAKAQGARVIVTSSSDDKLVRMQALGATDGVNYRQFPEWSSRVIEVTDGHGADLVLDMGGRSTIEESVKCLAYEGTLALVGGLGGYDASVPSFALIGKAARALGVMAGSTAEFVQMCDFMARHRIHPCVDATYDFGDYQSAMAKLASGDFVGKLVLRL